MACSLCPPSCPLIHTGSGFASTDGKGSNGVFLGGEALGEQESVKGLPFQGAAGHMLNRILHRGGFKREEFLIGNFGINCRPPDNYLEGAPYEFQALANCEPFLKNTLKANPHIKVLVPMGNVAMWRLLGLKGIKNQHGYVNWSEQWQKWIVPTIHPSAIMRGGFKEFPTVLFDINRAVEVARQGFRQVPVSYTLWPNVKEFEAFVLAYEQALLADPDTILASDIETAFSSNIDEEDVVEKDTSYEITRISFSHKPHTGITLPFTADFLPLIQRALGGPGMKVFWNGRKFDCPRLRAAGVLFNGLVIDGMDCWHVFRPDLPKGLGYVAPFFTDVSAWKNLADSNPEFYSTVDSDTLIQIILKLRDRMRQEGIWETFLQYWTRLDIRFEKMSQIGVGIDEKVREERTKYYENVRDNTAVLIQENVEEELKPVVKKGGYKGKPKDVRELIKTGIAEEEAWSRLGYSMIGGAWNKRGPFNHNSPQQIIKYITDKYDEKSVPRDKKTGRPTTGLDELERLARRTNDSVLNLIIDAANADGKITSFIKPWTPGPDGRIHGVFTHQPATHRIASQNPNLQNFPRRDDEASLLRQMVIPGEGWKYIVEADWKSIEAILVGFYAKSPTYMRIAYMGIHDFMAGVKLGMKLHTSMSDEELRIALKEAKKLGNSTNVPGSTMSVRDACKVSVHGGNYREGPVLLHKTYPELFTTVKDAKDYQSFYFDLFPDIPRWQAAETDFAHQHCYVENAWRLKRWFYAVKNWVWSKRLGQWELVDGDEAKKAIATKPQGSAGMMMRHALMSDAVQELLDDEALMITIHDSLVARARDDKHLVWVVQKLKEAMEYPVQELGGIVIPIETKIGENWGPWHKDINPNGMKEVATFA